MSRGRWWRFLPDRSQLMLLAGVLIAVVTTVGFVNLTIARSAVQAELRADQARVAQLLEQKLRLQDELARDQQGENVAPRAEEYFDRKPPDTTTVFPEAVATPDAAAGKRDQPSGPPYWAEWWKRLTQP
ncbi:MAG: hypothetical protein NT169_00185 [Chloroflexi bacterium]|nr:hypothetical protein [Chloroflexota bacterium]